MCFYSRQSAGAQTLEARFAAKVADGAAVMPQDTVNGFVHPHTPVITDRQPQQIQNYQWGLIPHWARDYGIQKYTLNAKIETLHQKPSFRYSLNNRCLVLADGFYEWQWQDSKGRQKQKYLITLPTQQPFAFAGIWSGKSASATAATSTSAATETTAAGSYSVITAAAVGIMCDIHNHGKRMPVILSPAQEHRWLAGTAVSDFAVPTEKLTATPLN